MALLRFGVACGALHGASACDSDETLRADADGSFGTGAPGYNTDGGLDGGSGGRADSGLAGGPTIRVRFLHGIPNTGALQVCHDPDGPGPIAAQLLKDQATVLRAEYGTRSATVSLPAISSGTLSLQREASSASSGDGGTWADGGARDAGPPPDPCDEATREATITLPISTDGALADASVGLLPALTGASAVTLLGTGVALDPMGLAARTPAERSTLEAAFGARALIQLDSAANSPDTFSLSVFHALPDVPPADPKLVDSAVGALRMCITAGTRDSSAVPKPPLPGIPFRVRTNLGDAFDARLAYDFRVFVQGDFDAQNKDCATTSLMPVAKGSFSKLQPGKAYTIALLGAIAPSSLCSADTVSIVRASCSPSAAELGAKLVLLED
jgi:hypothetical protein